MNGSLNLFFGIINYLCFATISTKNKFENMKFFHLIIVFAVSSVFNCVYCQSVELTIKKDSYKIDEEFIILFESNVKIDSIGEFKPVYFKVLKGPNKNEFKSKKNGEEEYNLKIDYTLKPTKAGPLEIKSPVFYFEGNKIELESKYVTIIEDKVTEEEQFENDFDKFKAAAIKPKNTIRYVLFEDYGYIEIFDDLKWNYKRRLTSKEVSKLKEIK